MRQNSPPARQDGRGWLEIADTMKPCSLKLAVIRTDAGTQVRVKPCQDTVTTYAEAMQAGDVFPPVVVFHDGSEYFMADGFHRLLACVRLGYLDVLAEVRKGTRADALKYALGANTTHGLRRSNADKHRSVELALAEWPKLSSRELAKVCAVCHTFVDSVREGALATVADARQCKDGRTYPVKPKLKEKAPPKSSGKSDPAAVAAVTERVIAANESEGIAPPADDPPRVHSANGDCDSLLVRAGHMETEFIDGLLGIIREAGELNDKARKTFTKEFRLFIQHQLDGHAAKLATALAEIK